jgi:hypothetical protein
MQCGKFDAKKQQDLTGIEFMPEQINITQAMTSRSWRTRLTTMNVAGSEAAT